MADKVHPIQPEPLMDNHRLVVLHILITINYDHIYTNTH